MARRKKWPDAFPHCLWSFDEYHDAWDTACSNKFQLNEGRPEENGMVYCCYCGRILHSVGIPPSVDAVDPQDGRVDEGPTRVSTASSPNAFLEEADHLAAIDLTDQIAHLREQARDAD
jgi:hypothetical protein